MKKSILAILFCVAAICGAKAQDNVMKFDAIIAEYNGNDAKVKQAVESLNACIPAITKKFGWVSGRETINIDNSGFITFVGGANGDKTAEGQAFSYDPADDAINLGFLSESNLKELSKIVKLNENSVVNTSTIMSNMIADICASSSPERGICLSDDMSETLNKIKKFNYKYIYDNDRFNSFKKYAEMILNDIFEILYNAYSENNLYDSLKAKSKKYPTLMNEFRGFLAKYTDINNLPPKYQAISQNCLNHKIYSDLTDKNVYVQAIFDYIAGMIVGLIIMNFMPIMHI